MAEQDTVIVVATTEIDEYGNLIVTDKGGGKTKIGKKREHLFPIFQQGKAVLLHWETYMNRPYVANAKLAEGELPQAALKPDTGESTPKEKVEDRDTTTRLRSMILSYCKDLAVADKIKVEQIVPQADRFYNWVETGRETTIIQSKPKEPAPVIVKPKSIPAPEKAVKQLNSKNPEALTQITTKFKRMKNETLEQIWLRLDDKQKAEFIADVNNALAEEL